MLNKSVPHLCAMGFGLLVGLGVLSSCTNEPQWDFAQIQSLSGFTLDASEIKLLELRFRAGELDLYQVNGSVVTIDGEIVFQSSDETVAQLAASTTEFKVTQGPFTRIELPEPSQDNDYVIRLKIGIPESLDGLQIVLGRGEIRGELDLPLKTDLTVTGAGAIDLTLPPATVARVVAEVNSGEIALRGFENILGAPSREFTRATFDGYVGMHMPIGKRVDLRLSEGRIRVKTPVLDQPAPAEVSLSGEIADDSPADASTAEPANAEPNPAAQ